MLLLSRTQGEEILIGNYLESIRVVVVEIRGKQVRLGIEAPKNVKIIRPDARRKTPQWNP